MPTKKTLDYLKSDLDDMIYAVSSVITIVNSDDELDDANRYNRNDYYHR